MMLRKSKWAQSVQTRDFQISVYYKFIEAHRSVKDRPEFMKNHIYLYLGEASYSHEGSAFLPFLVEVETEPEAAFFRIKGGVFVEGPRQTVEQWVSSRNHAPPKLWPQVYSEILEMLSILAYHIRVPLPNELREDMGLPIKMKEWR